MMADQFHAELVDFVLGVRGRRKSEAALPVGGELLLLQLGVQAPSECHLNVCREAMLTKLTGTKST